MKRALKEQYGKILAEHLRQPDEAHLFEAYNLGKRCAEHGVSMSELIDMHFSLLNASREALAAEKLPTSQEFLLEVSLAMSVGSNRTLEHVLGALYDESVRQLQELAQAKAKLADYSLNLEEKVRDKLFELQLAEDRFETLVQTIPDIVFKIDQEGRFVYLNNAIQALGYEPAELLDRHFSEIIFPADLDAISRERVLAQMIGQKTGEHQAPKLFDERRTGERRTSALEVRLRLKSGGKLPGRVKPIGKELIFVEVSSSGLYTQAHGAQDKSFIGTVGVVRDISDRKKVEEKLRRHRLFLEKQVAERTAELLTVNQALQLEVEERQKTQNFLNNILDSMGEGVAVIDSAYTILSCNSAFARQVNRPLTEIIGQPCYQVSHGRNEPCHKSGETCPVLATLETGKPSTAIHQHWDQNGNRHLQVSVKSYPMPYTAGRLPAVIELIEDVTEQRKTEARLQQAQKMEAIGTMAGGIAHDFNNILTAILGFTEIARMKTQDSEIKDDLTRVYDASQRAKDLVRQILTFSRHSACHVQPVSISPIIKEAMKLLRATLPSSLDLQYQIDNIPEWVMADPTQIHQILMNLCTNAAHAIPDGIGEIEVRLASLRVDEATASRQPDLTPGLYARLTVKDSGAGMSPEVMSKIFEPYFTTKRVGEGTGLGLAVVHGIVKTLGGAIEVQSALGQGSTFEVYLPVVPSSEAFGGDDSPPAKTLTMGHGRILLVDDETDVVHMGVHLLKQCGYEVVGVSSSVEALELFDKQPERFDLLITDMTMPKLRGDKLAEKILAIRPDLPMILCTGFSQNVSAQTAKERGFKGLIMKPYDLYEFSNMVRRVMEGKTIMAGKEEASCSFPPGG